MQSQSTFVFAASPLPGCDPLFLAWLAGFVDGEGCITIARRRSKLGTASYAPVLAIANTVRAPLEEIAARIGAGTVHTRLSDTGSFVGTWPLHSYRLGGPSCRRVVAAIAPYLRVKAEQAAVIAAFVPLGRGAGGGKGANQRENYAALRRPQEVLHARMRELNGYSKRGRRGSRSS